jgi:hypothetical protein
MRGGEINAGDDDGGGGVGSLPIISGAGGGGGGETNEDDDADDEDVDDVGTTGGGDGGTIFLGEVAGGAGGGTSAMARVVSITPTLSSSMVDFTPSIYPSKSEILRYTILLLYLVYVSPRPWKIRRNISGPIISM